MKQVHMISVYIWQRPGILPYEDLGLFHKEDFTGLTIHKAFSY